MSIVTSGGAAGAAMPEKAGKHNVTATKGDCYCFQAICKIPDELCACSRFRTFLQGSEFFFEPVSGHCENSHTVAV